jgi:hypothetical protein
MLRAVLVCVVCLTGLMAVADDLPPNVQRLIELGEIRRKERLAELEGGLLVLKARLHETIRGQGELGTGLPANAIGKGHAVERAQEKIDAVLRDIEAVKMEKIFYPNVTLKSMRVGDIGLLADPFGVGMTAKISKIVDDKNMIVTVDAQPIWLQVGTKGQKVGKQLALTMPFEVTGTTTHKSVGSGSKKLFMLAPFHFPDIDVAPQQAMKGITERSR